MIWWKFRLIEADFIFSRFNESANFSPTWIFIINISRDTPIGFQMVKYPNRFHRELEQMTVECLKDTHEQKTWRRTYWF